MSSPNFSLYLDSLLSLKRGESPAQISEKICDSLEKWGYIEADRDEVVITRKGLNVLEFYLRNRDFMNNCSLETEKSLVQIYSR